MEKRKEILSQIFNDCWKLCKAYCLNGDDNWDMLIGLIDGYSDKYRQHGDILWHFYRAIADALVHMKEQFREGERQHDSNANVH